MGLRIPHMKDIASG
ncbi:UNVERIFIED_CONTAM: hypothetical protein GTU68_030030 [Idotea baltica]|nr:hypothetical protein [Idotea baltica]